MGGNAGASGFPPEFLAALRILADASEDAAVGGHPRPVLVGGAAVELWTSGRYVSGDFDLVTSDPSPIERALLARGFRREDRSGYLLRGLYHPMLGIGVEFVSGQLFDGRSDRRRLRSVDVGDGKKIVVIPPEDVIADRLGQDAAASGSDRRQLVLARMVYQLAQDLDAAYLLRRVADETGVSVTDTELRELLSP